MADRLRLGRRVRRGIARLPAGGRGLGNCRSLVDVGRLSDHAFLGASVQSGTARILVVNTGLRTVFGTIAARLGAREPETDFGRGVRQFGYLLLRAMVIIVLFVLPYVSIRASQA